MASWNDGQDIFLFRESGWLAFKPAPSSFWTEGRTWSDMPGTYLEWQSSMSHTVLAFVVAMGWGREQCLLPLRLRSLNTCTGDISYVTGIPNCPGVSFTPSPPVRLCNPKNVLTNTDWLIRVLCIWSFLLIVQNSNLVDEAISVQQSVTCVTPFVLQECVAIIWMMS